MRFCPNCGSKNTDDAKFCISCGNPLAARRTTARPHPKKGNAISNFFSDYIGTNNDDLNWKILFTDIFKSHTREEAEEIFICGTKKTTPPPSSILSEMPTPWFYSRVFAVFSIAAVLLWICCTSFQNSNTLPGLIMLGSLAVPLSVMIMFLELNVWKDYSLYNVIIVFLIGGCASLVATLFIITLFPTGELDYVGAFLTGLFEEAGKAIIVYLFLKRMHRPTILRALLIGACVGAGFAAFESAGYSFNCFLAGGFSFMMNNIFLRGFLAPGGHVVWAAISGAAMVIASKAAAKPIDSYIFSDSRFLRLFAIPVVLHALWDCPLCGAILPEIYAGPIFLLVCAWIVILLLINMGLAEVAQISRKSLNQ